MGDRIGVADAERALIGPTAHTGCAPQIDGSYRLHGSCRHCDVPGSVRIGFRECQNQSIIMG